MTKQKFPVLSEIGNYRIRMRNERDNVNNWLFVRKGDPVSNAEPRPKITPKFASNLREPIVRSPI
jgi:hypothetical protein